MAAASANEKPVAVISGGSSGIGKATVKMLAERGFTVCEISRSGADTEYAEHYTADITDEAQVRAAFERIHERHPHIDVLINNAGMGISGPVEFSEPEDIKRIISVNFLGACYCIQQVLPDMRAAGKGRIVNLSSVAAPAAIPFQAFYSATKSAVSSLTLALRNELAPFGIKVAAVLPGDVNTGFTAARKKASRGDDIYTHSRKAVESMEKDERGGMKPEDVARHVVAAATEKNPRPLRIAGAKYRIFYVLLKFLPVRFSNWVIGKMY